MDKKEQFLSELVCLGSHESQPLLIGGYQYSQKTQRKNKDNFDHRWPFLFNVVIDGLCLKELEMSGRQFTWANNLTTPTYEKLDRVLVTTELDLKYPLSSVVALNRDISDHIPLLLNFGESNSNHIKKQFKFELG